MSTPTCTGPIVQAHCAELGVAYERTSLITYRQALRHLHEVGAPARAEHAARGAGRQLN
jgi:hypothetical protein